MRISVRFVKFECSTAHVKLFYHLRKVVIAFTIKPKRHVFPRIALYDNVSRNQNYLHCIT